MILEVRHLRLVRAIHREGTLTRAAEALHLTQPAASHALRELESRLDLKLFHRKPRGMQATPGGVRLVEVAGRILGALAEAERELRELKGGQRGVLRVTTQCYTCYHWIPRILASFSEDFPYVELEIAPDATRRPIEALLGEEVDLAILHTPAKSVEIATRHLFRDELLVVVAPHHPFAGREVVEASDFADVHLIHYSDYSDSVLATQMLTPAAIRPRKVSNLQLTEAVVAAVAAGLGVAVLPDWTVREEVRRGRVAAVPLSGGGLYRDWYAAVLKRRGEEAALAALIDRLQRGGLASSVGLVPLTTAGSWGPPVAP